MQNIDGAMHSERSCRRWSTSPSALGVEVTAEGVETTTQRDFLIQIGCDELQGFLLSKPLPADELSRLLGVETPAKIEISSAA